MKTKIYVGASFEDRLIVKELENKLKSRGFKITSNWTEHFNKNECEMYAKEDLQGIKDADILVVYNSSHKTTGKITEIGMAIYKGIPVLVFGEPYSSIFSYMVQNIDWIKIQSLDYIARYITEYATEYLEA